MTGYLCTGIPLYMNRGRGGGIALLPGFVLDRAVLTEDERNSLLASAKAIDAVGFSQDKALLDKLRNMLGRSDTSWIEVDFSSWNGTENGTACFNDIRNAILERRVITFFYTSAKAERLLREVMPLKLVFKSGAWYLFGFCKMREDSRFFKLKRIDGLRGTDKHFERDIPEPVLAEKQIDKSTYVEVVFRITEGAAFRVYDEMPQHEADGEGGFICRIALPDIGTACDYAASYGQRCTIIAPKEAVSEMRRRLQKTLENYI